MTVNRRFDPLHAALFFMAGLVCLYMLAPLVLIVVNSFNQASTGAFPPPALTLHWYANALFGVPDFRHGLVNSLVVAIVSTALCLAIAIPAGYGLSRLRFRGREILRTILMLPILMPTIVLGAALFLLYIRIGLYGSLPGLIVAHTLLCLPFALTVIVANLQTFGRDHEEAAMDLGAGPLATFFKVTLPGIRAGVTVAALLAFITSFDQVDITIFLARPETTTLPLAMFAYAESFQDPTLAAVSSLLLGFTALLVVLFAWLAKSRDFGALFTAVRN